MSRPAPKSCEGCTLIREDGRARYCGPTGKNLTSYRQIDYCVNKETGNASEL